jgi:hypothetical protein
MPGDCNEVGIYHRPGLLAISDKLPSRIRKEFHGWFYFIRATLFQEDSYYVRWQTGSSGSRTADSSTESTDIRSGNFYGRTSNADSDYRKKIPASPCCRGMSIRIMFFFFFQRLNIASIYTGGAVGGDCVERIPSLVLQAIAARQCKYAANC